MGVKVIVANKDGTPLLTVDSTEIANLFNTLPNHTQLEVAIQEPNFEPITIGDYFVLRTDVVTPPPQPTPAGLIYSSNIQGNWSNGVARFVTDKEGNTNANGYGFTVNASGGGGFRIDGKGQGNLEPATAGHRRIYVAACNYNARIQGQFCFLTDDVDNFSLKGRNRHQYADMVDPNAPDSKKQGGLGCAFHRDTVDFKVEVVHGTNVGGTEKSLPAKLVTGKWYPFSFSYKDASSSTVYEEAKIDYGDGKGLQTVLSFTEHPASVFFNKADFDTWSQFWLRLNDSGKIGLKNIELYSI